MQLLSATCPYCGGDVETTRNHIGEIVNCPNCKKPLEMEIPTADVTSVREVATADDSEKLVSEPSETILHTVHPVVFRGRPIESLIMLLVTSAAFYGLWMAWGNGNGIVDDGQSGSSGLASINWLLWLSIAALCLVIGFLGYWWVLKMSTTLTITDSRSIYRQGIIHRDSSEVQHDDVRNIKIDQSLLQRILRFGDVAISSSGQDEMEIVALRIANPERIVKTIRENQ